MPTPDNFDWQILSIFTTTLYLRREKNIWLELEWNLSPLTPRANVLTIRPWLLGKLFQSKIQFPPQSSFVQENEFLFPKENSVITISIKSHLFNNVKIKRDLLRSSILMIWKYLNFPKGVSINEPKLPYWRLKLKIGP